MPASTKLVDKLEGVENFCAWKYKIGLILEENDLAKFIKENAPEPEEDAAKVKYKKDMVRVVDHLFRLGVNVMYHEDMYHVVQQVLKTFWLSRAFLPNFCNRDVCSPAWDNNVMC
jgi:hypothetical protein